MYSFRLCALVSAVVAAFSLPLASSAQAPQLINYQGRLLNGTNLVNGSVGLSLRLFDASTGGTKLYEDSNTVTVVDGLYATQLGDDTNFGTLQAAFENTNVWIEVAVNDTALTPRERVVSVAYALTAQTAAGVPPNAITASMLATGAVTESALAVGSVTAMALASNSVFASKINAQSFYTTFWLTDGNFGTTPATHFLGTLDNQPLELRVNNARALRIEPGAGGAPNFIAGSAQNSAGVGVVGVAIAGGSATATNVVNSDFGHIGGGGRNTIAEFSSYSTIGGGIQNSVWPYTFASTIGGGNFNTIQSNATFAAIGGGTQNSIQESASEGVIGGGAQNAIQTGAVYAVIGGGNRNRLQDSASYGVIGGGNANTVQTGAAYAFIGGGNNNGVQSGAGLSVVAGGFGNVVQSGAFGSVIVGGQQNRIQTNSGTSFVGGGSQNSIQAFSANSVLGGGTQNTIQPSAGYCVLAGGSSNSIQTNAEYSFLGGGFQNTIRQSAHNSVIAGGGNNSIENPYSFIGGGFMNSIDQNAGEDFIGGGMENHIAELASLCVLVGGNNNSIQSYATGSFLGGGSANTIEENAFWSVLAGGDYNTIQTNARYSSLGGGYGNKVAGMYGTVPGGEQNTAGAYAFAAGLHAKATNEGSFVWADLNYVDFGTTSSNQFLIRAGGGVGIGTTTPATQLHLKQSTDNSGFNPANDGFRIEAASGESWTLQTQAAGDLVFDSGLGSGYAYISKNQGTFNITSDARFKKNIQPLGDTLERVLQLQPVTFQYKAAPDESRPVVGFVAQDVEPLFPDLVDVKDGFMAINYGGFGPVAIRAIQEMDAQVGHLKAENAELKQQLEALARRQQQLESSLQAVLQAR